ncbi:MAG: ABC transporter permease, partial [Boseongicola sp. SB0673_bin_14]|nr:ABC transporter permease [Boseongicola sp. SB0673_bin_14]
MIKALRTASLGDILGIGLILFIAVFSLLLLIAPSIIVVTISFDTRAFVSFPPEGFTLRWYAEVFEQTELVGSMWTSLKVGLMVTALCILLGVPTALACVRGKFRGTTALSVFVLVPHMVPGIVLGVAVLFSGALV